MLTKKDTNTDTDTDTQAHRHTGTKTHTHCDNTTRHAMADRGRLLQDGAGVLDRVEHGAVGTGRTEPSPLARHAQHVRPTARAHNPEREGG